MDGRPLVLGEVGGHLSAALDRPAVAFLDAPVETDPGRLPAGVVILGVPHGTPYPDPGMTAGCAAAPAAIRERSRRMARFRGHHDFDLDGPFLPLDGPPLTDAGDVAGDPDDAAGNAARAEAAVRAVLAAGATPIVLGGDDSVPIPVLRAYADRGPLTVLQVDAHLDYRDEVAGERHGYSSPMRRAAEMAHVARIVHVGLHGTGSARASDVADSVAAGNLLVTAEQVRARGVDRIVEQLPAGGAIFVSLDCDGLDPSVVPAVSAPSPGGLAFGDVVGLVRGAAGRGRLVGAVITELVPALDGDGRSTLAAARLAALLAGVAGHPRGA